LLDRYPLANEETPPTQAVIIGFGRLGRAVLREIARRPRPDGSPVSVNLRGETPQAVSNFLDLFPVIRRNCTVTCDSDTRPGDGVLTYTFVCLPDNDDALNAGLAAAHSLTARADLVVICLSEPSPFGAVLTGEKALLDDVEGRLTVFEVVHEACMPARIREDLASQLARAIHRAYVANRAALGERPNVNPSMRPWEQLPDELSNASLAQSAHIGTKLETIDCIVIPESPRGPDFAFTGSSKLTGIGFLPDYRVRSLGGCAA
jgi:hypothetical protein